MWRSALKLIFGAHAQVAVGVLATLVGIAAWLYWSLVTPPTVTAIFHVSMFFGVIACYAIIATGLGYRATERVEQIVIETVKQMDVDVDKMDVEIET